MEGFYGIYYTGAAGSAAFGVLLLKGKVYGVDPSGGDVSGTYVETPDRGIDFILVFNWPAGTSLVTGQTLVQAISLNSTVSLTAATLAGGTQLVELPIGRVNLRVAKRVAI
jgi:hypothetical protein